MLDKHKCGAKVHDPSSNQDQDQQSLFANLVLDPVLPLDVENPETGSSFNYDPIEIVSMKILYLPLKDVSFLISCHQLNKIPRT